MKWKLPKSFKIPRRKYLRPQPPTNREKMIGYAILLIVIGIGVAIYLTSRRFDPNLFRLDPELINKSKDDKSTTAKNENRRQGASIDGEPRPTGTPVEGSTPTTATGQSSELLPTTVTGSEWARRGNLERFNSETLYNKVDGREGIYKKYEFNELLAADYSPSESSTKFIQVEMFDMTTANSALGVFTAERPAHITPAKIGKEAYTDTNGAFFWKGKYYVRVIGSDAEKTTQQAAIAIAETIAAKIPESKDTQLTDPLPVDNRVPNSFTITPEGAFGQAFFKNVYSARFKVDKVELNGFVMATESEAKATGTIDEYQQAMESFGKLTKVGDGADAVYHMEVYGTHYVIFARGKFVGGVMEADAKEPAIKLARQIAAFVSK